MYRMNKDSVMFSSKSNEWETPQQLFDTLNAEFSFTIDVAATSDNAKCQRYYTKADDALSKDWRGETVFMNPPYGREIGSWVRKAWTEMQKHNITVVMLIPARTDTSYFQDYCLKGEVRYLRGRLKFSNAKHGAPFPSGVVVFRRLEGYSD